MTDVKPLQEPRAVVMWLLCLVPVLGAYANVGEVGFMWDDQVLIVQNTDLHTLAWPWAYLVRSFWQHPFLYGQGHAFYRPLVSFSLALDWAIGAGSAAWFHFSNLLLHLWVVSVVFVLALRRSGSTLTAAALAALFGVTPRLTESVTWVVGRTDIMASAFVLTAVVLLHKKTPWAELGVGVCLLLGLLAKEVALVGVGVVALLLWLERPTGARFRRVAVSVGSAVVCWFVLRASSGQGGRVSLHGVPTALAQVGHYALMTLTPWNPVAQIGFILDPEPWATALGAVALVSMAGLVWRTRRTETSAWLLGATAGVLMVSVVVLTVYTIASDRFLYLPLAMGALAAAGPHWPRWGLVLMGLATLLLAPVTWRHNRLWAAPLAFWAEVKATASPRNPGATAGLADAYSDLSRFEEALPLYLESERIRGRQIDSPSRLSLAVTHSKLGHDREALALLTTIIAENPAWKRARYDLVLFRARAGDVAAAQTALAQLRRELGDDEVLRSFDQMLQLHGAGLSSQVPLERARALHGLGATRKAETAYLEVLRGDEPRLRIEAARWLVTFGSERSARAAEALVPDQEEARAILSERFPD